MKLSQKMSKPRITTFVTPNVEFDETAFALVDMTDVTLTDEDAEQIKVEVDKEEQAYDDLRRVLYEAYVQSSGGKGKERHANGKTFDRQPILEISRMVGHGFALGQAMKKASEAAGMVSRGENDRAVQECLGVIVYAAAAVLLLREQKTL